MDTLSNVCMRIFLKKVIKFIYKNIPRFYRHTHQVITYNKDPTKNHKWKVPTPVTLKYILSGNQHCLPLTHMAKTLCINH